MRAQKRGSRCGRRHGRRGRRHGCRRWRNGRWRRRHSGGGGSGRRNGRRRGGGCGRRGFLFYWRGGGSRSPFGDRQLIGAKDDDGFGLHPAAAAAVGGHIDPEAISRATNRGEGGAGSQRLDHGAAGRIIEIAALCADDSQAPGALGQRASRRVDHGRDRGNDQC
ncbi:MAG: hypothetical protein DYG89_06060 [Caldilinea sp. CFX5]|nr:hypothetical protein [Caldilinea sp. CFX5]